MGLRTKCNITAIKYIVKALSNAVTLVKNNEPKTYKSQMITEPCRHF